MSIDTLINSLKQTVTDFQSGVDVYETGVIAEVGDGIAVIKGLESCESNEMIEFENGSMGIALNLEEDSVGTIILGDYETLEEGQHVKRTKKILSIPVSMNFIGRVVDPLGNPLDDKGTIVSDQHYPIEKKAPGVMEREPVSVPLQTGIKAIDSMIPIGRGQRELLIGDRQTGKTAVAIDAIINQKDQDVLCVYVAIGQKRSNIARLVAKLEEKGAMEYTTIVVAGASDAAALSYVAPYTGTAIAEYYMDQKKDVLIVYDDLSKHAVAYREVSLLLRRPPGREAYPGDVFYLHSRLLERSCRRNAQSGGGSLTALPIIETQAGDVSAYIPTNVISITDGQIFFEAGLFYKGIRPAVNMGLSVSRVGSAAQITSMKKVAGSMKLALAQFRELEAFAQFASDLDADTKAQIDRGQRVTELLKQPQYAPLHVAKQVASVYAVANGHLDEIDINNIRQWEEEFYTFLETAKQELLTKLETTWDETTQEKIKEAITQFNQTFNPQQ